MRTGRAVHTLASAIAAVTLFSWGCTTEPGLDKGKFAALYGAAQDLKTVIGSGTCGGATDAVVQRLASGTAALKDRTASKAERDLLSAYTHLLATCRDGLLLCQFRTHLSNFQFVPKGRIYVTQELDPIVEKYGLPTERHLYEPTGKYWRSISGDSITVIWERAGAEIKNIENMTNYN
jgi:hypothetical protein